MPPYTEGDHCEGVLWPVLSSSDETSLNDEATSDVDVPFLGDGEAGEVERSNAFRSASISLAYS